MLEKPPMQWNGPAAAPRFAAGASEDLIAGGRALRAAFLQSPVHSADRGAGLIERDTEPQILLLRSGFAYRSSVLADGRRAILDVLTPGEIVGLDHVVVARPVDEFTAANRVGYNALPAAEVRRLMTDPQVGLRIYALLAESRWRAGRLAVAIGRLDARTRLCLLLLDIYERLRRRDLINRPTYNLPLTQEQLADHLGLTVVHVNRTLRRLREEKLVIVDRQVVIILDLDRLRAVGQGLPPVVETPAERVLDLDD